MPVKKVVFQAPTGDQARPGSSLFCDEDSKHVVLIKR